MQALLKTLKRALRPATKGTSYPPGPHATPGEGGVLVHHLPARRSGPVHVAHTFRCDNIDKTRIYTVSASIWIPQSFTGRSVDLSLHGYRTLSGTPVDMSKRDTWQHVSAVAEIPADQNSLVPALTADYDEISPSSIYSKDWQLSGAARRKTFKHTTCAELVTISPDARIVGETADIDVPVAPIRYGQTRKPDFPVVEYPPGGWEASTMEFRDQKIYELRNAVIHGEEGIVTVGDYVLEETYLLASLDKIRLLWAGDGTASFECTEPTAIVGAGSHHFSGYPGNRNYAHWMVDILPSINIPEEGGDSAIILPDLYYSWQSDTLDMVDTDRARVFLKGGQTILCERLTISYMRLVDSGHWPHPSRLVVARQITATVDPDPAARRRIYISRLDSGARRMVNEPEIIALAQELGFEILTLTGMPVAEQIRAFAEAEIVLGSHGAGLSNVVFCRQGTIFCEMLVDGYVQWSMRRLASVLPLRYGCAIGREIGSQVNQHDKQWQIDPDCVREMLRAALAEIP